MDTMLGISMEEYNNLKYTLLSTRPNSGSDTRYVVDSIGRVWSNMVDYSDISLANSEDQGPVQQPEGQQESGALLTGTLTSRDTGDVTEANKR